MARIKIEDILEDDNLDDADLDKVSGGVIGRLPSTSGDLLSSPTMPVDPILPSALPISVSRPGTPSDSFEPNYINVIIMNTPSG